MRPSQHLTFRCNTKRNRKAPPKGSIVKRKGPKARYAYKLETPNPEDPNWFKLVVPGQKYATQSKSLAVSLAWGIYHRYYADVPARDMDGLLEQFQAAQALRVSPAHLRKQMVCVRTFVEASQIADPADIAPATVNAWLASLKRRKQAPSTIQNARANVGRFCSWLHRTMHQIPYNPVRETDGVTVPARMIVYMADAEWTTLRETAEELKVYPVLWAMYSLMRKGEIRRLKRSDIQDSANGKVIVIEGKDPRGGRRVESIPLHSYLARLLTEIPEDGEYVFPWATKHYWGEKLLQPLRAVCPTLRQRGQGWHTIRRSAATRLLRQGVRIERVSRLLRHREIRITEKHYGHLTAEAGRGDLEKL